MTWPDVPLAGGRKRKYTVVAKVMPTAASLLVFAAACPNCPSLATESTVTVRDARAPPHCGGRGELRKNACQIWTE